VILVMPLLVFCFGFRGRLCFGMAGRLGCVWMPSRGTSGGEMSTLGGDAGGDSTGVVGIGTLGAGTSTVGTGVAVGATTTLGTDVGFGRSVGGRVGVARGAIVGIGCCNMSASCTKVCACVRSSGGGCRWMSLN
jgi:hypothetical protein